MALSRPLNLMPLEIAARLDERGLRAAYDARPAYQRNDYLGWIARAKRPATQERRIARMISELEQGGVYMNMVWRGRAQT